MGHFAESAGLVVKKNSILKIRNHRDGVVNQHLKSSTDRRQQTSPVAPRRRQKNDYDCLLFQGQHGHHGDDGDGALTVQRPWHWHTSGLSFQHKQSDWLSTQQVNANGKCQLSASAVASPGF